MRPLCAAVGGPPRKDHVCAYSDEDGGHSFNQEEPLPGVQSCDAIHVLKDSCGQETGENICDSVTGVPDRHSHWGLVEAIPRGGDCKAQLEREKCYACYKGCLTQGEAREEWCFTQTDEEASHTKACATVKS